MIILLLILVFAAIALYEIPNLARQRCWRELTVFSILMLLAFTMTLLQTTGVLKPGLMNGLSYLIKDILHIYYK